MLMTMTTAAGDDDDHDHGPSSRLPLGSTSRMRMMRRLADCTRSEVKPRNRLPSWCSPLERANAASWFKHLNFQPGQRHHQGLCFDKEHRTDADSGFL
jgi:hypothetical protein